MLELIVVLFGSVDEVPYFTCDVPATLVVHVTVAEFVVMFDAVTFEIEMPLPPLPLVPPPPPDVSRSVNTS
jgi:hypothetical protein